MAFSETAPLIAALKLDDKFSGPLKNAGKALGSFDAKLDHTQTRAFRAGQQIGTGIKNTARIAAVGVGILVSQVALGLNSLIKLEQAQAQTAAVLKSTGAAAGQTGADITRLSEKFESLNATVGDEFVRAGANMLLTFTNIRGKAFEPALAAILDLNTAMGNGPEGLTKTAIQVGKALNDPTTGLTALRRVGVAFSDEQVKRIKQLQTEGKLYEAQGIILKELNKEFGGSFIAQGNTTAGKVAKFTDAIDDLQRALAEALLPTLGNVADALTKTLADPAVVEGVRSFGKSLADLISPANLAEAGSILQSVFNTARAAAPGIAAAAQIMGQVVGTAVGVFRTLPKEIQQLAIGAFAINKLTGGLVTNVAGGILGGIAKGGLFSRGSSPANPLFVADVTGGGAGGAAGGLLAGGKWAAIGRLIGGAFAVVAAAEIADMIHTAITPFGGLEGRTKAGKLLPADQLSWPFGPKNTPRWVIDSPFGQINVLGGDSAFPNGEQFGPPGPGFKKNPVRPGYVDSPRTTPADVVAIEAALKRGREAGFFPTFAAAQQTLQRDASRAAERQKTAADRLISASLAQVRAGERLELAANHLNSVKGGTTINQYTGFTVQTPTPKRVVHAPGKGPQEFASGEYDVPYDMPAKVHKGEMIVPRRLATLFRQIGLHGGPGPIFRAGVKLDASQITDRRSHGALIGNFGRMWRTDRHIPTYGDDDWIPPSNWGKKGAPSGGNPWPRMDPRSLGQVSTPIVHVAVHVTAAQVTKSVVIQKRFGPPGGSRESDAGHIGGAGT